MKKSIIPGDREDRCFLCGSRAQHVHHCLHGIRRKKADQYGLTVHLCFRCHQRLHDLGENDLILEQVAERIFVREYGFELFMREFGKNYLEETEARG